MPIRAPTMINIPEHYFTKPVDVIVERDGEKARAVDRYGNRIVEGTDHFVVYKNAVEEMAKKKAGESLVVYAFNLNAEVPENDKIIIDNELELLEMHCINCYFKRKEYTGVTTVLFEIHGDKVKNLIFDGHGSTTFYDIGRPFAIKAGTATDMYDVEFRRFKMYIPDEYVGASRWGGFGIGFNFPGNVPSKGYHVDRLLIEGVKAYNLKHSANPESVLLYMPRVKRLEIVGTYAINATLDDYGFPTSYWNVIETYGVRTLNGAEEVSISRSTLLGIIGLRVKDMRVSESTIGHEVVVSPLPLSIDESTLTVNAVKEASIRVTNSRVLGFVAVDVKYKTEEGTGDRWTIDGKIASFRVENSLLIIDWGANWACFGGYYRWFKEPVIDIDEFVINNCTVYNRPGGANNTKLVTFNYGGYIKKIELSKLTLLPDPYLNKQCGLIALNDGDVADLTVDNLIIKDVDVYTVPDYIFYYGSSSTTYKTTANIVMEDVYLAKPGGIKVNASASLTYRRMLLRRRNMVDSGLVSVGAGATLVIDKFTGVNHLLVTEMYLYDPDGYMKLQVYCVTDATVVAEITGTSEKIDYIDYYANGKTFEIRLVNTDTTNAHNARGKVVYSTGMP